MEVKRYGAEEARPWDLAVTASRQGTFLLMRDYMDYHADRFTDASLLFYDGSHGRLRGVLPATVDGDTAVSHGGLTYGGLLTPAGVGTLETMEMLSAALDWFRRETPCRRLLYKPVPHIYHTQPAEEDLYALFRLGGRLVGRSVAQVTALGQGKLTTLRRRGVNKARKNGLAVSQAASPEDWRAYWAVLTAVLTERHGRMPVHTLDEIMLLHGRFPQQVRLFTVKRDGAVLGGCVVYVTRRVAHVQYIAAGDEGRGLGALDLLFAELNSEACFPQCRYFDFGISTEQGGAWLNEGLTFQKEGFGGRGVCYDEYEIAL